MKALLFAQKDEVLLTLVQTQTLIQEFCYVGDFEVQE
jgi:hypothetical protein